MSPEDLKQIFFHCHHKDINGYYANDVDIIEYGQKVAAFALAQRKPMSELEIMDLMLNNRTDQNGTALLDRMTVVIRAVEKFHGIR